MLSHVRRIACASLALVLAASGDVARAQTPFLRGQGVQPVYEGFQKNADGTISMVFGYLNRNFQEEPFIPVGANNFFEPGPQDRGQPTHFDTRRQSFIFMVKLPADWGNKDLVWTINHNGRTATAIGSLLPSWIIDEGTWRANRGSGIGGRTADGYTDDKPPVVQIVGPTSLKTTVAQPLTVTASASDDGRPGPRPKSPPRPGGEGGSASRVVLSNPDLPSIGGDNNNAATGSGGPADQNIVKVRTAFETGLAVTWRHYRGAGSVTFTPQAVAVRADGKATTQMRFSAPGTYVIKAVADDSSFTADADLTVVVEP
jgi:hypothetical protein